jgi:signal transduction histidine kinase
MPEPVEPYDDLDEILDKAFAQAMQPAADGDVTRQSLLTNLVGSTTPQPPPFPNADTGPIAVPDGTKSPLGAFSIVTNRGPATGGSSTSIVEALTIGILISDREGLVRATNRAARRILGDTDGTMVGTKVADVFETADRSSFGPLLEGALQGRPPTEVDLVANGPHGPVGVRVAASGRFDAEHRLKEVVWSLRESGPTDPSVEVRIQEARTDLLAELGLELAREIGPIALRLSEALLGARQILDQVTGAGTVADRLRTRIADASSGLLRLEQAVSELERFASVPPIKVEPVDPSILVARAETLIAGSLRSQRIRVRNDMDDPPPRVLADAARLTEIFVNLLRNGRNAIVRRYGGEGGESTITGRRLIVIESFIKPPWVVISITNNGLPIPASAVDRVFLPSVARGEARRPLIGLPETAALVRMMGGAIRCQSLDEEGTRFILTLRKAD